MSTNAHHYAIKCLYGSYIKEHLHVYYYLAMTEVSFGFSEERILMLSAFQMLKNIFFPSSLANYNMLMTTECSSALIPPYIKIHLPICELSHLVDRLIRWLNYDFWIASSEVINLIFTNILLSTPTINILYAKDKFVSII